MPHEHDETATTQTMPSPAPQDDGRFLPGTVFGARYRIVARAGRGGMGEVYRADDLKIGQAVALKFLPPDVERDPRRLERLMGEVRMARRVSHPNVCRVYDVGDIDGQHFITMEYVDGEDLAALLRRIGRLPQEKALDLARQIGAGLAAAHAQGIVHRDLKPSNIMLDGRGRARITDFGLAAISGTVRGQEAQWGTPAYMAPEQLAGDRITSQTDVYALGLVLYEMFTGQRARGSGADKISAPPSSFVPGLDPAIDTAILKCLEPEPARRPASAVQLLAAMPGGDLLEAALRAGDTPLPEEVAAAGEVGTLAPGKAWGLFGLNLIAAALAIFFCTKVVGLDRVPMPRSPDALRDRAREVARQLGNEIPAPSEEWWIGLHRGASSPTVAGPPAVRFAFRQSPRPLLPRGSTMTIDDPPPTWSGEAFVALDLQGRLVEFSRLDRQLAPPDSGRAAPIDWSPLWSLVGIDPTGLKPVEPLWTPRVACDTRAAWTGSLGGATTRWEAAGWRGKPVWFRTIAPWEPAERDDPGIAVARIGQGFFVGLVLITVLAFAGLVRHNLRLGRGDLRGASRVATFTFLTFAIADSLSYRWAIEPLRVWKWMLHLPYFPAITAWLMYLGVEPFLRRRWPHRLIAWSRLLEGRFADPLVGREILIGSLTGAAIVVLGRLPAVIEKRADMDLLLAVLPLGRAADFWGLTTGALADGLMKGLGSFALFLLLRVIVRRDSIAWILMGMFWVLTSLTSWTVSPLQWAGMAAGAACFVLAARVGVVSATAVAATSTLLTYCTAFTLDFSRWYAWRTGAIAVVLFAIVAWGFRAVMGRRRIFSAAILEG